MIFLLKQLISLINKDRMLAKNHIFISFGILIVFPLFLNLEENIAVNNVYTLFMSISFSCYILFTKIFTTEDKYKGNSHLMAIPYTRLALVLSKYLMVLIAFLSGTLIYFMLSTINLGDIFSQDDFLSPISVLITFIIISMIYSVFFPLYFRYSYDKIKVPLFLVSIIIPSWIVPAFINFFDGKFDFVADEVLKIILSSLAVAFSIVFTAFSINISLKFIRQKDF